METHYLILIAAVYGACIHFNYIWFHDLAKKYTSQRLTNLFILSGPILTGITIFVVIRGKIRIVLFKRRIHKEIERQLPDLLNEFNITVEGKSK